MRRYTLLSLLVLALVVLSVSLPAAAQGNSPLPDPYADLTIEALTARSYGGGVVTVHQTMAQTDAFARYLFSYPSDDLTIYGFMNVPTGPGPFPVIVALHGYIEPAQYYTLDYTTHYADELARAGYLVLHPNLRGYRPSDDGPNLFRVGMAIDVLHLVAIVRQTGGLAGELFAANPESIGLWGHSMGGGITLRVITVDPDIRAAVLYGSMSGNEEWNYTKIMEWSGRQRGREELEVPREVLHAISAAYHLDRIDAAVSIHHGAADALVPPQWSDDLCGWLQALDKVVQCVSYPGQPHTFHGEGDRQFITNTIAFFDAFLKADAIP